MDVLLEEYNELKTSIMQGQLDSSTAFRLITLVQYLKQTLNKKSMEIAELKESRRSEFKDESKYN